MSKTVVSSDNAPAAIGPYSPGIQTGNMVFLSGQLGIDPTTGKMPEGVEAQAKQSLSKFEAPFPARSAFQVAALPAGGLVEIEVVAAL